MVYHRKFLGVKHRRKVRFSHRQTDRHAHTGAQRTCGGFHPDRMAILRMARRFGIELTELPEVIRRQAAIPKQMQQRVQEGGPMTAG